MLPVPKSVRTTHLSVAYEDGGDPDGPPVILVHGFPDDARTWDPVVAGLGRARLRTLVPYVRGFGPTEFLSAAIPRSGQVAALAHDIIEFADALGIGRFALVGHDWGARAAYAVAACWPDRLTYLVTLATGYGAPAHAPALSLSQARAFWYQWFLHLDRGRIMLERDRTAMCRYLWEAWSPGWRFDESAYAATARSFQNPDFVEVVVHYYRHRWGNAPGAPFYERFQARLAETPSVAVPTMFLCGAADGANLPESSEGLERFFTGPYTRRPLPGVGHFVQREAPDAVIEAIVGSKPE